MSKPLVTVIVEGPTDFQTFSKLLQKFKIEGYHVLEHKREQAWGESAALKIFREQVAQIKPYGVFLALDLDDRNEATLYKHVEEKSEGMLVNGVHGKYVCDQTQATIIPVGLPEDNELKEWGIEKFAIDDYLFKLVLEQDVFVELTKGKRVKVDYQKMVDKLREIRQLMVQNGLPLKTSKSYLLFFIGIINGDLQVSLPTLAERLIDKASCVCLEKIFANILCRLAKAT
jgi:glutathione peroxidase-family protein